RATAAVLRGVRLWEDLLLNTDSFCAAAGRAARGDRPAGGPAGQNRAVRGTSCAAELWPGHGGEDRKSTRLNSSHVKISYAVFCGRRALHSFPTRRSSDLRATAAVLRGVRLWEDLLLNTDSFCAAAGRAARGDRPAGGPAGQNRAVRGTSCAAELWPGHGG